MGISKSPAGVPWNYGPAGLMKAESEIYPQWLADAWGKDQERVDLVRNEGFESAVSSMLKIAALTIWSDESERLQVAAGRSSWSIRHLAKMNKQAYESALAMPFSKWADIMIKVVLPTMREELGSE